MGNVEEGDADAFLQRLQLDLERAAQLRIKRAERFIEQEHGRVEHERAGQRDPLLLAAGQLARPPPGEGAHPHQVEGLVHPAPEVGLAHAPVPQPERHVVEHVEERE